MVATVAAAITDVIASTVWIILIPNEYNSYAHTHLAIKERQIASKYLAIHDCQIAIAHLAMKEHQIASNLFSKRERQVTSNHLAMLVMLTHLAMKEHQFASNFFRKKRTPSDYRNSLCMYVGYTDS